MYRNALCMLACAVGIVACGNDHVIIQEVLISGTGEADYGPPRGSTERSTMTAVVEVKFYQCVDVPQLEASSLGTVPVTMQALGCNRFILDIGSVSTGTTQALNFRMSGGDPLYGASGVSAEFRYLHPVAMVNGIQITDILLNNLTWQFDRYGDVVVPRNSVTFRYRPATSGSFDLGGPLLFFSYDIGSGFVSRFLMIPDPDRDGWYRFVLHRVPFGQYEANIDVGYLRYAVSDGVMHGDFEISFAGMTNTPTTRVLYVYPSTQQNPWASGLDLTHENLFFYLSTFGPQPVYGGEDVWVLIE